MRPPRAPGRPRCGSLKNGSARFAGHPMRSRDRNQAPFGHLKYRFSVRTGWGALRSRPVTQGSLCLASKTRRWSNMLMRSIVPVGIGASAHSHKRIGSSAARRPGPGQVPSGLGRLPLRSPGQVSAETGHQHRGSRERSSIQSLIRNAIRPTLHALSRCSARSLCSPARGSARSRPPSGGGGWTATRPTRYPSARP